MTAESTATLLDSIATVVVPVTDQQQALAFYRDALGLELRRDFQAEAGFRWLEVAPAESATTIALVPPRGGMWGSVGGDTRIILHSNDITATHAGLRARGIDVDDTILRLGDHVPPMFRLRDPDGNEIQIIG
ncbi:VOC family protein [Nocardia sp. NPDC059240]|uniref:VOC family protein n=1 Tax=Nocardia sp. NPDC059240 TaxID=3346786 RepID=UPI0036BAF4AC